MTRKSQNRVSTFGEPAVTRRRARRRALRGSGDYSAETKAITNPIKRVEAKIDHLEKSLVKSAMSKSDAASTIGRTLGNFVNQGDLGALAGSTLAKYFGHGDYNVKVNSLMKGAHATGATFHNEGGRGTRITEREFIGDIVSGSLVGGSTAFTNQHFVINPTNASMFPWLSRIAPLYDQWEPNGIVLEFVSTSSEYNGTSQALGTIIMATDYDPYDALYSSKPQMENSDYACSTKPALDLIHGIECADSERPTRLLYTSLDNGAPKSSSQLGTFQVATQGMSVADVSLGELWVSYDITFYKKQLSAAPASQISGLWGFGSTGANLGLFADPTISGTTGDIFITQNVGVGSVINFGSPPAGSRYIVHYLKAPGLFSDDFNVLPISGLVNCTRTDFRHAGWADNAGLSVIILTADGVGPMSATSASMDVAAPTDSYPYVFSITEVNPRVRF